MTTQMKTIQLVRITKIEQLGKWIVTLFTGNNMYRDYPFDNESLADSFCAKYGTPHFDKYGVWNNLNVNLDPEDESVQDLINVPSL